MCALLNTEVVMEWKFNDGGREAAGFKGSTGDCVVRAISIATERTYQEVYDAINELAQRERPRGKRKRSSARTGVARPTYDRYLKALGWHWYPTMKIGSGTKVHLRTGELPERGRLIVRVSKHICAVIDGVVHDTSDPSREGNRCVYGYYGEPHKGRAGVIKISDADRAEIARQRVALDRMAHRVCDEMERLIGYPPVAVGGIPTGPSATRPGTRVVPRRRH